MRRSGRTLLCAVFLFMGTLMAGGPAYGQKPMQIYCRWGKLSKMAAMPKCGVPREVEVKVPANTWKLYFLRNENPGLSGYFHRGRAPGAVAKVFMRKVNLVNVVLLLCPPDFKSERVLAFQQFNNQKRLLGRPTCRLGPSSGTPTPPRPRGGGTTEKPRPGAKPSVTPAAPPRGGPTPASAGGTVYDRVAGSKPAGKGSAKGWKKIDRTARLLGMMALAIAIMCIVALAVLFRYFSRKVRKLEEGG